MTADAAVPERQALGRTLASIPAQAPGAGRTILDRLARHDERLNLTPAFVAPARVEDLPAYLSGEPVEAPAFVAPPAIEYVEPPVDDEPEPSPEPVEDAAPVTVSEVVPREQEAPKSLADIRAALAAMSGGPR
jgi:hypothetical protein